MAGAEALDNHQTIAENLACYDKKCKIALKTKKLRPISFAPYYLTAISFRVLQSMLSGGNVLNKMTLSGFGTGGQCEDILYSF